MSRLRRRLHAAAQRVTHYKVKHVDMAAILTIPAHRPIKPVYIRELVRFIDGVRKGES